MDLLSVTVLALIQALTEFIPVSSSGHLLLVEELTPLEGSLALDVALHFGTLIALLIYFWPKLWAIATDLGSASTRKLVRNLIISTLPAVVVGFLFQSAIETNLRSVSIVIFMLAFIGIVMIWTDKRFTHGKRTGATLQPSHALVVGLAQVCALIPGTSRSGITMIASRWQGMSMKESAEYVFLMAIPVTAGACVKVFFDEQARAVLTEHLSLTLWGIGLAAVAGLATIHFLMGYLKRHGLAVFGYYRLALSLVLLIVILNNQ